MNNPVKLPLNPATAILITLILMTFGAACSRLALPRIEVVPAWDQPQEYPTPPLVPVDAQTTQPTFRFYV